MSALRRFVLATEVVHDEDAAGGFELQRCLVGARRRVVDEVEHVEAQLAAGDHRGPLAAHVAFVEGPAAAQRIGIVRLGLGG